jgi:hypothetical protein
MKWKLMWIVIVGSQLVDIFRVHDTSEEKNLKTNAAVWRLYKDFNKTGCTVRVTEQCNHCCCGKALSITYSKWVFVDLGIQHAMRMRRIVICSLHGSVILFHVIS